ncbi:MAG: hypothetical protein KJO07_21215 [Deltaproteobacteria bacterium]|nr:hypothetical protein [Deltaproteobacteria bacterium]
MQSKCLASGRKLAIVFFAMAWCLQSGVALAQEKPKYLLTRKQTKEKKPKCKCEKDKKAKKPKRFEHWDFKLRVGSMAQLSSSRAVIGRVDGTSRSFGAELRAEANFKKSQHELRNRIDANTVFIKTPNTRRWVSSTDVLELESIYQYRLSPITGPFTRAGMMTSMFVGRDLRTNAVQYLFDDGTMTDDQQTELRLTDPFSPVTVLESLGWFLNPVRKKYFDLDFRGGLGARQVFADGQLGVQDDSDTTDIVEVVRLKTYFQAGLELIAMTRGVVWDKKVSYYFGGEFLLPVVRSEEPGDDRSAVSLIDKKIRLGVAYRIAKWATLLYEIRLVHQPQLLDKYQVQNNVGFKGSYSVL